MDCQRKEAMENKLDIIINERQNIFLYYDMGYR